MAATVKNPLVASFPNYARMWAHPGVFCKLQTPADTARAKDKTLAIVQDILASPTGLAANLSSSELEQVAVSTNKMATVFTLVTEKTLKDIFSYTELGLTKPFPKDECAYRSTLKWVEARYLRVPLQTLSELQFHAMVKDIHAHLIDSEHPLSMDRGKYRISKDTMVICKEPALNDPATALAFLTKNDPAMILGFENWKSHCGISQLSKEGHAYFNKYYIVCPPSNVVESLMTAMYQEIKTRLLTGEDPIKVAAFAHNELTRIHPFFDANGRAARIVMNMILMQAGHLPIAFDTESVYTDAIRREDQGERGAFEELIRMKLAQDMTRNRSEAMPVEGLRGLDLVSLDRMQTAWNKACIVSPQITRDFLNFKPRIPAERKN